MEANDLDGVKLLIKYGAGIAPESGERLPLEIAKSKGFLAIAEYLQGMGGGLCVWGGGGGSYVCGCGIMYLSAALSHSELMDKTSRAEVKSSEGHSSSQLVSLSIIILHLCIQLTPLVRPPL